MVASHKHGVPSSRFPVDGGALDQFDKHLSRPCFRLQIGLLGECLLSAPGCWFGCPSFLLPSMLLLAYYVDPSRDIEWIMLGSFTLFAGLWYLSLMDVSTRFAFMLYSPASIIASPAVGGLLLAWTRSNGAPAAYFFVTCWFCGVMPVLILKKLAVRRRPAACHPADIGVDVCAALTAKRLQGIVRMLRRDTTASFPSGDVSGATSFAFCLATVCNCPRMAIICVVLSAFGRMYWQAHHLLDCFIGAAVTMPICLLVEWQQGGALQCIWWHPVVAVALIAAMVKLLHIAPAPATVTTQELRDVGAVIKK